MRDYKKLNIKKPFTEKTVLKYYPTVKSVLFFSFRAGKERSFDL
jgi:hypothetical protein